MNEASAQYLTFMYPVFRGCNAIEAVAIFVMYLVAALIISLLAKLFIGYFFIAFLLAAILTQTLLFRFTCSKYGDYKSNKPPGVVNLKLLEYGKYLGLKPKHVTRSGNWKA